MVSRIKTYFNIVYNSKFFLLFLVTDSQRYFDYHHSALDVVANVNERELALGAAAVAYLAVALADR